MARFRHGPRSHTRRSALRVAAACALLPSLVWAANPEPAPSPPPKRRPHPPPLGLRVEEIDAAAARALGVTAGLRVVYCIGLAYERGLRLDDVIVEVDGRAVTTADAFWAVVDAAGGRVVLQGRRAGKRLTVKMAG